LANDSTKQLFVKDYNWLGVLLHGLMQAKIRHGMVERVSFFDSLSSYIQLVVFRCGLAFSSKPPPPPSSSLEERKRASRNKLNAQNFPSK
jgi:hypothetical protein